MKTINGIKYKSLNTILRNTAGEKPYFPNIGVDGYGGEISGDYPDIFGFGYENIDIPNRAVAKKIYIPEKFCLNWAEYSPSYGWRGAVGIWASDYVGDEKIFIELEKQQDDWDINSSQFAEGE